MPRSLVSKVSEYRTEPIRVIEFILKLASDPATSEPLVRKRHVLAIVDQLEGMSNHDFFPEILNIVDPSQFYSQTKLLPDYAKGILSQALDEYCGK